MKHLYIFCFVNFALCILLSGCGQKDALPTIVVSGTVKLDGVPAEGVNITFNPVSDKGTAGNGVAAGGVSGKGGKYTLTSSANSIGSGALEGEYIPTFSKFETEKREPTASPEEEIKKYGANNPPKRIYIVPQKYDDMKTCGIEKVKVEKGKANVFDFDLKIK